MSKVRKAADTEEEEVRLAQGDDTSKAPPKELIPAELMEGVQIHLAKYEAQYGTISSVVRPVMYSQHRLDMKTKAEWESLFEIERNRRIT